MKTIPIVHYPDILIKASKSLLNNCKILNCFIKVLFNKCNVHSHHDVEEGYSILTQWINHVYKINGRLPSSFDYRYLTTALKITLKSEIGYNVAVGLSFIYRFYHLI